MHHGEKIKSNVVERNQSQDCSLYDLRMAMMIDF